jgi:hypothetical protein
MAFDTLNFALIAFALFLLAVAAFRANCYQVSIPPPKLKPGFQP